MFLNCIVFGSVCALGFCLVGSVLLRSKVGLIGRYGRSGLGCGYLLRLPSFVYGYLRLDFFLEYVRSSLGCQVAYACEKLIRITSFFSEVPATHRRSNLTTSERTELPKRRQTTTNKHNTVVFNSIAITSNVTIIGNTSPVVA